MRATVSECRETVILVLLLCVLTFIDMSTSAYALESYNIQPIEAYPSAERFTNANWHTVPHPQVASFSVFPDGSSEGMTVTGVYFVQYDIPNDLGVRVQRFEIQDHYHYIVEGEPADTFSEFSALLAEAYHDKIAGA